METTRIADAARGLRHVFLRDLLFSADIGVYAHEHGVKQRVRVNVDLGVADDGARAASQLVETLAERIAEACLSDPRIALARVRVEKLDVLPHGASAGVEVERRRHT